MVITSYQDLMNATVLEAVKYRGPLTSAQLRGWCVSKIPVDDASKWRQNIAFVRAVAMLEDEGKIRRDGNVWRRS